MAISEIGNHPVPSHSDTLPRLLEHAGLMAGLRHCPRRIPLRGCGHLNIIDLLLRPLTEGTGTSLAKRTVKRVRKLRGGNKIRMTSPNSKDNPPARFYTSNAPKRVDSLTSTVIVAANQE